MTVPTSDTHFAHNLPRRPQMKSSAHSMFYASEPIYSSSFPSPLRSGAGDAENAHHRYSIDFASCSRELATGGLKTLTAKREIPPPNLERSAFGYEAAVSVKSYRFYLAILVCVILMLIGGGAVMCVMLQP
ncbi:hypothetical protein [Thermosporothrix hazakensis]|uniref:hypothetical protein n=2 Tax=Thermosporothrix hazakensis TaxID=644383 RepID=UPI0010F879F2|nr:hypothetical protein [Thermosporothrix hazakensis]